MPQPLQLGVANPDMNMALHHIEEAGQILRALAIVTRIVNKPAEDRFTPEVLSQRKAILTIFKTILEREAENEIKEGYKHFYAWQRQGQ